MRWVLIGRRLTRTRNSFLWSSAIITASPPVPTHRCSSVPIIGSLLSSWWWGAERDCMCGSVGALDCTKLLGHSTSKTGKMVKTFQAYLPNCHRRYSCIHCRAHLANHDDLISKVNYQLSWEYLFVLLIIVDFLHPLYAMFSLTHYTVFILSYFISLQLRWSARVISW